MAAEMELTVRVHSEDDGSYWAEVQELPGCFASGDTFDELLEALSEAVSLYLTDNPDRSGLERIPSVERPLHVDEMKVLL
jgi:predicted RNase H-like HicB family nuclease